MQFIPNGPDIPIQLLKAHEEGKVVFFCGAGISMNFGLPNFENLAYKIYELNHEEPIPTERNAIKNGFVDEALESFENRIVSDKISIRKSLHSILKPDYRKTKGNTHKALLDLAKNKSGEYRIVTTNFDRIFSDISEKYNIPVREHIAPYIPIPKPTNWNGLVYLHGRLPNEEEDISSLKNLVLTSGDFGLAYLREYWASRFVNELFRNFVVCFVGYGINDPILKYMLDALSADRKAGESQYPVYAFIEDDTKNTENKELIHNAIIPIRYKTDNKHSLLHDTLIEWANVYSSGVDGKVQYVLKYASSDPSKNSNNDDYVGRMIWALTDYTGIPAKKFAEINPPPTIEWLYIFSEKDPFSFFGNKKESEKSNITEPIVKWMFKHINSSKLILWFAENRWEFDKKFIALVEDVFTRTLILIKNGEIDQKNSPYATLSKHNKALWWLILRGYVPKNRDFDFYNWITHYKDTELDFIGKKTLYELCSPKIQIQRNFFSWNETTHQPIEDEILIDVVLACQQLRYEKSAIRKIVPPEILFECAQKSLTDFLDLSAELGLANEKFDRSAYDLPSIAKHPQNKKHYNSWVVLIELLRDIWLDVNASNHKKAMTIAISWWEEKYAAFKRLALFAASKSKHINSALWIKWILADNAYWLWGTTTYHEVITLLSQRASELHPILFEKLEDAIMGGPQRSLYRKDISDEEYQHIRERKIWYYFAKIQNGGCNLSSSASDVLSKLSQQYGWELDNNSKEDFLSWSIGSGDPEYENRPITDKTPDRLTNLVEWLGKKKPKDNFYYKSDWAEFCTENYKFAAYGLYFALKNNKCSKEKLNVALATWCRRNDTLRKLWQLIPNTDLSFINNTTISNSQGQIISCLTQLSENTEIWKNNKGNDTNKNIEAFCNFCFRVTDIVFNKRKFDSLDINDAINDPCEQLSVAIFKIWISGNTSKNSGLTEYWKTIFGRLLDVKNKNLFYTKFAFGEYLNALYYIDKQWVKDNMYPLFLHWSKSPHICMILWAGVMSNKIDAQILYDLKTSFLKLARHISEMKTSIDNYTNIFVTIALSMSKSYGDKYLSSIIKSFPQEELYRVWTSIRHYFEYQENKIDVWNLQIKPFYQNIFPKDKCIKTPKLAHEISMFIVESNELFSDTFKTLKGWLSPCNRQYDILYCMSSSLPRTARPMDILEFLSLVLDDSSIHNIGLEKILTNISKIDPSLQNEKIFSDLMSIC